jgi:hypothetical protein
MDMQTTQVEVYREFRRRWADADIITEGLAIGEELAEVLSGLLRSILKRHEGTRGTAAGWSENLRTEIGQAALVLMNLASLEGWNFETVIDDALAGFHAKPDIEP